MQKFLDAHCHILPGVDDGAKDIGETRKMLKIAYDEGIRIIIATPHRHEGRGMCELEQLKAQLLLVQKEAKKIDENIHICLGMEVFFGQDVPDLLKEGKIATIHNSNYVLLEFSQGDTFTYIQQSLQKVQAKGYRPIIAHAERYDCLVEDILLVRHLVNMGICVQVNANSIVTRKSRKVSKFVKRALDEQLIHLIGTDAHSANYRKPEMQKAAKYIEKRCGEHYAKNILGHNGIRIIKNETIS